MYKEVVIISESDTSEFAMKQREMDKKAFALTQEERFHICDMGFFNDVIGGYLIQSMRDSGFSDDDTRKALSELQLVFDDMSAEEALVAYKRFRKW